jgi:FkbM family methyltransferase
MLRNLYEALWRTRWRIVEAAFSPRRNVQCRGLRFSLPADNWITHYRWKSYNTKEVETLDWIDRSLKAEDTFFDIGSNIGQYSLYAALRHPGIRVIAFEPEYSNAHLLRDNVIRNGLEKQIQIYSLGLSNHCGLTQLHLQDLTPGAALLTESKNVLQVTRTNHKVVAREGIYAMTLDAFCSESGYTPQCIKIDVDGTEIEILEGAVKTLTLPQLRTILIEMPDKQTHREECTRQLTHAGFNLEWADASGSITNQIWCKGQKN